MFNKNTIDEALIFYDINFKYKEKCYDFIEEINGNVKQELVFYDLYKTLYEKSFENAEKLWDKKSSELLTNDISPFITNIMILMGYEFHKNNMKKYNFSDMQVNIHKKRVKECFESDLINRGYDGIRISQMLWAVYFIRTRIIEMGSLQFEFDDSSVIKIHIPKETNLNIENVKNSIVNMIDKLENKNVNFICNSWLLSNQIYNIINKDTNISQFHNLFDVTDGEECTLDILNFVYKISNCEDYSMLSENTSLQKK